MTDIVSRLMELADDYANRKQWSSTQSAEEKRQALEAELRKLFTPLSDEQIKSMYHRLCDSVGASYKTVARATEAAHGIGSES